MNGALVFSAFMLGLAGSGHCVAMCGGASGWTLRLLSPEAGNLARFHLGRIGGYALLGAIAASLGGQIQQLATWTGALRPVWTMTNVAAFGLGAALLATGRQPAMLDRVGTWMARWLSGSARAPAAGAAARSASPAAATWAPAGATVSIPVASIGRAPAAGHRAWKIGACWALMPCGLLYSAVVLVLLSGDAASGGLAMAAFAAAGAVPMLFAQRLFGRTTRLGRWERTGNRLIGAAICALAGWGIAMTLTGQGQGLFCLPGA